MIRTHYTKTGFVLFYLSCDCPCKRMARQLCRDFVWWWWWWSVVLLQLFLKREERCDESVAESSHHTIVRQWNTTHLRPAGLFCQILARCLWRGLHRCKRRCHAFCWMTLVLGNMDYSLSAWRWKRRPSWLSFLCRCWHRTQWIPCQIRPAIETRWPWSPAQADSWFQPPAPPWQLYPQLLLKEFLKEATNCEQ